MGKKTDAIRTQVFEAARDNKPAVLRAFFEEDPSLRTAKNPQQQEPIHAAAQTGAVQSLDVLMSWGVEPNVQDADGHTPLHLAVSCGHLEVARQLIDMGAEPWRTNHKDETVLHVAVHWAARQPQKGVELVRLLLHYKKYDIYTWSQLTGPGTGAQPTPLELAKSVQAPAGVVNALQKAQAPKEEAVITILLHGWNDNLSDWKEIESHFASELRTMVFLFAYNSLDNRVSISSLAMELRAFILEKRDYYYAQKTKVASFGTLRPTKNKTNELKINLLCYSTGGLIVREFLNKWYRTEFQGVIDHLVMLAPANFGSPFAKFGKSSVGRMYVGQKKVGSLFECGEELLTSLEPGSPFIWDLAHVDSLCAVDEQHFVPSQIKTTVIQGTAHYEKNLQSKVTRGDMKGTDGTVTISGASMRAIKFTMNLSGTSESDTSIIERSTSQVALWLHPSHTHRSITDSLVAKSDVFSLVKRTLESNAQQFAAMQRHFERLHEVVYSKVHTPANLLIFQYEGNLKPVILPVLLYHKEEYVPQAGQKINPSVMQTESRGNVVGTIRSQFSYTEYHSRSRNMFYKLVDLGMVSKIMLSMAADLPGCAVSLAICLKGHAPDGRIIGSTSWMKTDTRDCFLTSAMDTTYLFSISPHASEKDPGGLPPASSSASGGGASSSPSRGLGSSSLLAQLQRDEDLDDNIRQLGPSGILRLCKSLHGDGELLPLLNLVCKSGVEDLSGETRVAIIRSLVPFLVTSPIVQEAIANLVITTSYQQLAVMKRELDDSPPSFLMGSDIEELPSPLECTSLYQLVHHLLRRVPLQFLRQIPEPEASLVRRYSQSEARGTFLDLPKLVADYVHTTTRSQLRGSTMRREKPPRKLLCEMSAITSVGGGGEEYADRALFPGAMEFVQRLCRTHDLSVVFLTASKLPTELPGDSHVEIRYRALTKEHVARTLEEYVYLYPEVEISLLFPHTPLFLEAATAFQRSMPDAKLFLRLPPRAPTTPRTLASSAFRTFVRAALQASDRNMLSDSDVVAVAAKTLEELQVLLCRRQCFHPMERWEELLADIEMAQLRLRSNTPGPRQQYHVSRLEDIKLKCLQSQAAMWLSVTGAQSLLRLREWFLQQPADVQAPVPPSRRPRSEEQSNRLLVDMAQSPDGRRDGARQLLVPQLQGSHPGESAASFRPPVPPKGAALSRSQSSPASHQGQGGRPRGALRGRGASARSGPGTPLRSSTRN